MQRCLRSIPMVLMTLLTVILIPLAAAANPVGFRPDGISAGAEALKLATRIPESIHLEGSPTGGIGDKSFVPGIGFLAYNFDDNATENGGYLFIPPDPMGSAGPDRLVAVVNTGIECRTKGGALLYRDSLKDFFSPLGAQTLGTFCFDPKIVYDHYENRFVVVALEQWSTAAGNPSNESRILVAVSKTSSPATATAADWRYMAINSKVNIGGVATFADYPGFEVDEEAVYITANMFPFSGGGGGTRLWIINKGAVGGFYGGGAASSAVYDPIPAGYFSLTLAPALVFGAGGVGGVGSNIGTFLVGYSNLTGGGPGGPEYLQVIRVDNPLGATTFTGEFVAVGDLEDVGGGFGWPALPDAPQSSTGTLIEVNDSRALDAVWRNNSLWVTTTIKPNVANDPVNVGSTTAHWFRLKTTAVPGPITVEDQGNIGGEDIAPNTWTFFPSVAVNGTGDAKFGFSASAQTIFCGAYFAGREAGDPAGTVQASGVVQAGTDYYVRTFGGSRNRWGDYTGISVDPADDSTFWIYNEYAAARGTPTGAEDGRWGTAWKACSVSSQIFAEVYPLLPPNGPVNVFSRPDGAGDPLTAAQLLGDPLTTVDATIVVRLLDGGGSPVVGFPAEKISVAAQFGGWTQCGAVILTADAPTNINGKTTISGSLFGGGFSGPGELMVVLVDSPLLASTSYPGGLPGLEYFVNSADINGDLVVNLTDVSIFSPAYFSPGYDYFADFRWNGNVNLSDLSYLAPAISASCPAAKNAGEIAATSGALGIVFDTAEGLPTRMLEPGRQIDAYVVLSGAVAEAGIEAFTAGIRTSGNVVIHQHEIVGQGIDLGLDEAFVVGYAASRRADGPLALARLRMSVTDERPAHLWLEAGRGADGSLPAVVSNGELLGVRPVSGDVSAPVASLNDKDFDLDGGTPTAMNLSLSVAPNPFNPMTEIRFRLPADGAVELRIYDAGGKLVTTLTNEVMTAGEHVVVWNGTDRSGRTVSSGVYFSTLRTSAGTLREKMLLMK